MPKELIVALEARYTAMIMWRATH